jgi:protein-disulfide isomerase
MLAPDPGEVSGDSKFLETWKNAPRRSVGFGRAYFKGSRDPKLDVVEFVDLECSACRKEATELRKLIKKYPEMVRVAFRHFPLDNACNASLRKPLHRHACDASLAAECAGAQGEFWAYHDELFTPWGQPKPDLTRKGLARSAEVVGLDMDEFASCMEQRAGMAKIQADLRAGASIGVRSTPTLVINGRKISQSLTLAQWETIMRAEGIIR